MNLDEQIRQFERCEAWLARESVRVPKRPLTTAGWKRLSEIHVRHLQLQREYEQFVKKHGGTLPVNLKRKHL